MEQLQKLDNKNSLTSLEVAEMIDRPHNDLLKTIRQYIDYLGKGEIPQSDFFVENTYLNSQNKEQPCYSITRLGCDMIANKLTGAKGVIFTAKYVKRFDEMKNAILNGLSPELQAIIMQDKKLIQHDTRLKNLEDTKFISPKQKNDIQKLVSKLVIDACGGKDTQAYTELSKKLYSNAYHKLFDRFHVSQMAEIPFIKFEESYTYMNGWFPDYELVVQINELNNAAIN